VAEPGAWHDPLGKAAGSVIIHGQKVPVERPRLRDGVKEAKLGSYELFRRDDEMQRRVWDRVVRGLSMRSYDPVTRESQPSFGISRSAISSRFKVASGQRAQDLRKRDLSKLRLCALSYQGFLGPGVERHGGRVPCRPWRRHDAENDTGGQFRRQEPVVWRPSFNRQAESP
jgi:hypothetical protein